MLDVAAFPCFTVVKSFTSWYALLLFFLKELTHEMDRYRGNILGLCEMRWKNFGETTTEEGHKVFFSGKEDKDEHGVGFLVHKDIVNTVMGCCSVSGSSPSAWGQSLSTLQ